MVIGKNAIWIVACIGASQAGCSSAAVDIGENELSRSNLESYVATWQGYIEDFTLEGRSDRITLTVVREHEGTMRFGDGSGSVEPPMDPNTLRSPDNTQAPVETDFFRIVEHYDYPLHLVNVEDERLRIAFDSGSLYSLWCELQSPARQADPRPPGVDEYLCAEWGHVVTDSQGTDCIYESTGESIDCGKWRACSGNALCACDMQRCWLGHSSEHTLDAALEQDGQKLVGSYRGNTVRLTRVH